MEILFVLKIFLLDYDKCFQLQIALIDILNALDLATDFVVGLNIGEIAAGYARKTYSLSQAILSAYHIGNTLQRSYSASSVIQSGKTRYFVFEFSSRDVKK